MNVGLRACECPAPVQPQLIWEGSMKHIRMLLMVALLLFISSPAFALVPRTVFAEMGTATW